ncbi:MAG: hypothetical protein ACRD2L_13845 [Terriglobia bacterium]
MSDADVAEILKLPPEERMRLAEIIQCSTCEEFIESHRELDLAQKSAEVETAQQRAAQEKLETERYELRLKQTPPVLDDPDPHQNDRAVHVVLEKPE